MITMSYHIRTAAIIKSFFLTLILICASTFMYVSTAYAAPTFSNYPISSAYKNPGEMTVAGGALWYIEDTATVASNNIGKMTTTGVKTDYAIGNPPGTTSFKIAHITTGPDGNVWFDGNYSNSVYIGNLNISTGTVTFYLSPIGGYSAGPISTGSDGNVYYAVKSAGSPANTYLLYINPTTTSIATKQIYDTNTNISSMTNGPDGRLWLTDAYYSYSRVYATSLAGGASNVYYLSASSYPTSIISGPDGNIWLTEAGKIAKLTPSGALTEYTPSSGIEPTRLVSGPDGAIWFTSGSVSAPKIGRITTSGSMTAYTIPGTNVHYELGGPVLGPDNAIWFDYKTNTSPATYNVGRITTDPTFNTYSVSSAYKNPGEMTVAGGAVWYIQDSSTAVKSSIGKITTAGVKLDYTIGNPSGVTGFKVEHITTGADGNIWFDGGSSGNLYIGCLNITNGAVTFYPSSIPSYSAGPIISGSDGNIYYAVKSAGAPANTYLQSLNPATGTSTTKQTFDTNTNISSLANGPDGRLWLTDAYYSYSRVHAISLNGGVSSVYNLGASSYPTSITTGPDGNVWLIEAAKIAKITTSGVLTEYTPPNGVEPSKLTAGSDGAMWFVSGSVVAPKVGRITTAGVIAAYTIPGTNVHYELGGPVLGSDGAIWFDYKTNTSPATYNIGRIGY